MKKNLVIVFAAFFLVCTCFAGLASAQRGVPIYKEIESQQRRISQGVASGALTRSEAEILEGNLHYVRVTFDKARADGLLTPREEKRLRGMLQQNSKQIYQKKHNMKVRRLY